MPPAAVTGAATSHGGVVGPPLSPLAATVLIGGIPAAVIGQPHACVIPIHGPNVVSAPAGAPSRVLIGGFPAACMGDLTACGATILAGVPNVMIGG